MKFHALFTISGQVAIKGRNGIPRVAASTKTRNDVWVVGGDDYLVVWILDTQENRLRTERANLKKFKRDILVVRVSFCAFSPEIFRYTEIQNYINYYNSIYSLTTRMRMLIAEQGRGTASKLNLIFHHLTLVVVGVTIGSDHPRMDQSF